MAGSGKTKWSGEVTSVQPRFRLLRSFDQRHHDYRGYAVRVRGHFTSDGSGSEEREAWLGVGPAAHDKFRFRVRLALSGFAHPVPDPERERVEFYKVSGIELSRIPSDPAPGPPWHGVPPPIDVYRARGHRRLDANTYETRCSSCIWGARMPVEVTQGGWSQDGKPHRSETFCYGPKSCAFYAAGPPRTFTGRDGSIVEEADAVDADETAHRGPDD